MNRTQKKLVRAVAFGLPAGLVAGMLTLGLLSLGAEKVWAHDDPGVSTTAVVDVMVTPIVSMDLTANPTYYNFGLLAINTSSFSALPVNLQNTGNVGLTLRKHGNNTASNNWTIDTSSGLNRFTLYAATASARPAGIDSFVSGDQLLTSLNNLRGVGGSSQVSMIPGENASLWFRIDMPTATTTGASQSIPVHFMGNAQ